MYPFHPELTEQFFVERYLGQLSGDLGSSVGIAGQLNSVILGSSLKSPWALFPHLSIKCFEYDLRFFLAHSVIIFCAFCAGSLIFQIFVDITI